MLKTFSIFTVPRVLNFGTYCIANFTEKRSLRSPAMSSVLLSHTVYALHSLRPSRSGTALQRHHLSLQQYQSQQKSTDGFKESTHCRCSRIIVLCCHISPPRHFIFVTIFSQTASAVSLKQLTCRYAYGPFFKICYIIFLFYNYSTEAAAPSTRLSSASWIALSSSADNVPCAISSPNVFAGSQYFPPTF